MGGSLRVLRLPRVPAEPRARRAVVAAAAAIAAGAFAFAIGVCAARLLPGGGSAVRLCLVSALALAAAGSAFHRALRRPRPTAAWIVVDSHGVRRSERGKTTMLAAFGAPVGVTVFASADRSKLLVALMSPEGVRTIAARVRDAADAAAARTLIARATTAADGDLLSSGACPLSASDAEKLVIEVERRSPGAIDRLLLTDASGDPVVLDGGELRVGARRFDLSEPIEWRGSLFQELGAYAVSVFQATWIRQRGAEVVLVSPMPPEGVEVRVVAQALQAAGEARAAQAAFARDVRLMQAAAGEPPVRELRRAIDRLFMLPLRRALDRAPRLAPAPQARSLGEGRRAERDPRAKHG